MKRVLAFFCVVCLLAVLGGCGGSDGSGGGSSHINLVPTGWTQYTKYGDWAARGVLVNRGDDRAIFVQVQVDLLDASGTVIGSDASYVDTADASVAANQSVAFSLWAYGVDPAQVASVRRYILWYDTHFNSGRKEF